MAPEIAIGRFGRTIVPGEIGSKVIGSLREMKSKVIDRTGGLKEANNSSIEGVDSEDINLSAH